MMHLSKQMDAALSSLKSQYFAKICGNFAILIAYDLIAQSIQFRSSWPYFELCQHVGSDITLCIKIYKPLMNYRLRNDAHNNKVSYTWQNIDIFTM